DARLLTLIDDAVQRILAVKHQLGLFDEPYVAQNKTSVAVCDAHLILARKAVHQSTVLLKNEDSLLPLSGDKQKIALIGPLADDAQNQLGCWAFDGLADRAVTLRSALESRLGQERVTYAPGVMDCRSNDTSGFDAAVQASRDADVAVV